MNLKDLNIDAMQKQMNELTEKNRKHHERELTELLNDYRQNLHDAGRLDERMTSALQGFLDARAEVLIGTCSGFSDQVSPYRQPVWLNISGVAVQLGDIPGNTPLAGARVVVSIWPKKVGG